MPGSVRMIWSAGRSTSAVDRVAPATSASASPASIIITA
jgi:hypothetical protein